jgi:hypothetical protein
MEDIILPAAMNRGLHTEHPMGILVSLSVYFRSVDNFGLNYSFDFCYGLNVACSSM